MAMDPESRPTGTLGIERWVQFAFVGGTMIAFWFFDHLFQDVAEFVALKANMSTINPSLVTAGTAIFSILLMAGLYRNKRMHAFSNEVAYELANVTYPTRKETWAQTIVVFVVSIIAAIILGVFDAAWSTVTDLIY
jgi:preprotein translocase SecE subunit